jgi:hypothetical protein
MKYIILQHDNAADMQKEVQQYLDDGWRFSGGLVSHNGFLHQAMHDT